MFDKPSVLPGKNKSPELTSAKRSFIRAYVNSRDIF